nr:condensin complex subunit 2-like [Leptinotarsa decemlineata]
METSTPMPSLATDLRRRTLLKNAAQMSPLRKSMNVSLNASLLEESNDDEERSDRRNQQDIHKRLSNLPQRPSPMNESFIKEQFIICTHLFTENKINSKNAWKLQIIDLLKPLCQKSNKDTLQVASTSIDISAKVYGIRVDDIHSEGLKLANSMARVSERMPAEGDDEDGVENDGDRPDEEGNTQKKKKKKKRVNLSGKKCTVSDSSKTHCGPLPKLEPIEFTTRVNADTGTMENLYTNTFKESSDSFLLLNKTKTMLDDKDMTIQNKENILFHSLPPLPAQVTKINYPFSDFRLDEWDPDNEEKQ